LFFCFVFVSFFFFFLVALGLELSVSHFLFLLWFIEAKGYRLKSTKGKGHGSKSRKNQAQTLRCPFPVELPRTVLSSPRNYLWQLMQIVSNQSSFFLLAILGVELKALRLLGRHSTTGAIPPVLHPGKFTQALVSRVTKGQLQRFDVPIWPTSAP
jgi:hypothetical protein